MVAMADKCCLPRVVTRHVFLLAVLSHSATTHAVPSNECGLLAERGDCAFYECIETTYPCGQRGYTLGYGHHYCDRFNVYFHELTSEGQRWMDAVRKCLMKELHNYYVGTDHKTCASIKTFAFLSHPHCYTTSGPGFCTIITDPRNYDALYHGYQLKDFYGDDWKVVWQQVQETAVMCGGLVAQGFVDTLQDLYSSGVSHWRSLFARSGSDAD